MNNLKRRFRLVLASLVLSVAQVSAWGSSQLAEGIILQEIAFVGATVFSESELDRVIDAPKGQTVYIEDLLAMVDAITAHYVEAGYISSGAILPDQNIANGKVTIEVVEGRLDQVNVVSTGRLKSAFLVSRVQADTTGPLNLKSLQKAISRLEQEPTVSHVRGDLKPGDKRGKSVLDLEVVEADAFKLLVGLDNHKSPSVGEAQGAIALQHLNLLGFNDRFDARIEHTDGIDAGSVQYDFPVAWLRSRIAVFHSQGETFVVEEPFDEIAIESDTDTSGLRLTTTWAEGAQSAWKSHLSWESKDSLTTLLGLPFDFSPGSSNGVTEASVAGLSVEYSRRGDGAGLSIRAGFRSGSDELDLAGRDGDFSLYQVQARWIKRLSADPLLPAWLLNLNVNYQHSSDTLPAFERLGLGGHRTVRGYRENQSLKDSGFIANLSISAPILSAGANDGMALRAEVFYDYGRGENTAEALNVDTEVELSSAGVGFSAEYRNLKIRIQKAVRLKRKEKLGDALQDSGIHVGVTYEL